MILSWEGLLGGITPNELHVLVASLLTGAKIVEFTDTVKRIEKLEAQAGIGEHQE